MFDEDSIPKYILTKDTRLHHVFNQDYGSKSFNGSGLGNRRFDPISINGDTIPSYYTALTVEDAIVETILRENDLTGERDFTGDPAVHAFAELDLKKELILADVSLIPEMDDYLSAGEIAYTNTQALALYIAENTNFDGLAWYSKQGGVGRRCFVFFGHRVNESDLELKLEYELVSIAGRQHLKDAAVAYPTRCLWSCTQFILI